MAAWFWKKVGENRKVAVGRGGEIGVVGGNEGGGVLKKKNRT